MIKRTKKEQEEALILAIKEKFSQKNLSKLDELLIFNWDRSIEILRNGNKSEK